MTARHGPNKIPAEPQATTKPTDRAIDIPANDLTRRSFLRTSALGGLAAGATGVSLATGCGDREAESSCPTDSSSQFIQNTTQTVATRQSSGSGIQHRVVLGKSGLGSLISALGPSRLSTNTKRPSFVTRSTRASHTSIRRRPTTKAAPKK